MAQPGVTGITNSQVTQILARCWSDADYKARMMDDPSEALAEMGVIVPDDRTVVVAETTEAFSFRETGRVTHVNLPVSPDDIELSDDALDMIAAGVAEETEEMPICFLTTAVVRRRGEADDGPTLTALRAFRDGYMMSNPERAGLVCEYYRDAPRIAAMIPRGHDDWAWIADRVDAAASASRCGDDEAAFEIYAKMFRRLQQAWRG